MDALDEFLDIAHSIAWCSVATVDRRGRPRSRILHPVWERAGDRLTGWVGTTATALKTAHLAHAPYVSCSYWHPTHDTAQAECARDLGDRRRRARGGVGAAPRRAAARGLRPDADLAGRAAGRLFAALRLEAWRVRLRRGTAGGVPFTVWSEAA